jgi:hypothetical protein
MIQSIQGAEQRATRTLENSPIFDLRRLCVKRVGNTLHVSGSVSSYYHKQMAQEVVRAAACGMEVVNRVRVDDRGN